VHDGHRAVRPELLEENRRVEAEAAGLAVHPISPVFLFADTAEQFRELSPRYAGDIAALSESFRSVVGLPDEPFALVLRLAHNPPPSTVSRRASISAVVASGQHLAHA